jgi:Sec7-like guanine-nucleotide exchange factor
MFNEFTNYYGQNQDVFTDIAATPHTKSEVFSREKAVKSTAQFIYQSNGLDKQMIGNFLGNKKPSNRELCVKYFELFAFQNKEIDQAMRLIFYKTRHPFDSADLERIIKSFAQVYSKQNPSMSGDLSETMAYIILHLHTNIHNKKLKESFRLSKEKFISMSLVDI